MERSARHVQKSVSYYGIIVFAIICMITLIQGKLTIIVRSNSSENASQANVVNDIVCNVCANEKFDETILIYTESDEKLNEWNELTSDYRFNGTLVRSDDDLSVVTIRVDLAKLNAGQHNLLQFSLTNSAPQMLLLPGTSVTTADVVAPSARQINAIVNTTTNCTMTKAVRSCSNSKRANWFQLTENLNNALTSILMKQQQPEHRPSSSEHPSTPLWLPTSIFTMAADQRHHRQPMHSHHKEPRHRKRNVDYKKLQMIKMRRKHETVKHRRRQHHRDAFYLLKMPIVRRKLPCKYRKSCYESGIVPTTPSPIYDSIVHSIGRLRALISSTKTENETADDKVVQHEHNDQIKQQQQPSLDQFEIPELELKLLCRYRLSCYREVVQAKIENLHASIRTIPILATRTRFTTALFPPPQLPSIAEIARAALHTIEEDKRLAKNQASNNTKVRKSATTGAANGGTKETIERRRQLACKYRKSCYAGDRSSPVFFNHTHNHYYLSQFLDQLTKMIHQIRSGDLQSIQQQHHKILKKPKEFPEMDELEQKLHCKYRKSCYANGAQPSIKHFELFHYTHVVKKEIKKVPIELRCKYRKSCYATGILPPLHTVHEDHKELPNASAAAAVVVKRPLTIPELKLYCKYRKSCYHEKAAENKIEIDTDNQISQIQTNKQSSSDDMTTSETSATTSTTNNQLENVDNKADESMQTKDKLPRPNKDSKKPTTTFKTKTIKKEPKKKAKPEKDQKLGKKARNEKEEVKKPRKKTKSSLPLQEKKLTTKKITTTNAVKQPKLAKPKKAISEQPTQKLEVPIEATTPDNFPEKSDKNLTMQQNNSKITEQNSLEELENIPTPPVSSDIKVEIDNANLSAIDRKLLCKYRKSCYSTGFLPQIMRYSTIKEHLDESREKKKPLELRCKYRKSCYETGVLPPISSTFEPVHLVKKVVKQVPIQLRCKYRKSCYKSGVLPATLNHTVQHVARLRFKTPQLKCKYRKSCYATLALDIALQPERERNRLAKKQQRAPVSDKKVPQSQQNVYRKSKTDDNERQRKSTSNDSNSDSDTEDRENKSGVTKQKSRVQRMGDDRSEIAYKQIAPMSDDNNNVDDDKTDSISRKEKLKCKYRIQCYQGMPVHHVIMHSKRNVTLSIKDLQRENGAKCNIYYLSCRKAAGLPIHTRAPIGPNGKRLCRKKKKGEQRVAA